MTEFEVTLMSLKAEADEIQKKESELKAKAGLFNQKLQGFLKENGLPIDFTLPELALLAIRKSRA